MKTLFNLSCFSLLLLASCKKSDVPLGVNIDTQVNLILKNQSGRDLLNPSTPGYYNPENIRLYYLKDGKKQEVYKPTADYPRNFFVIKNEGNNEYCIRIFANETTVDREITTTYVQWNAARQDTIKTLMSVGPNYIYADKVWYNGELKFDVNKDPIDTDWGNGIIRRLIKITQP